MMLAYSQGKIPPCKVCSSFRNSPSQDSTHSRVQSQSLLDDSLKIGHVLRLPKGHRIRDLAGCLSLIDLLSEFGQLLRVPIEIVQRRTEGDTSGVGASGNIGSARIKHIGTGEFLSSLLL